MGPKSGFEARTTTDFWTVDRVTSASFTRSSDAAIWRWHLFWGQERAERGRVKLDLRYPKYCGWIRRGWNNVEVGIVLNRLSGGTLEVSIRYERTADI
jgi:hypothetical protein